MTVSTNLSGQRSAAAGKFRRLVTSFQRPANTTAYTAGDVIGDDTAAEVLGFTDAGPSGRVIGASVVMGETDTTALELLIFDEEPTNIADNGPIALVQSDLDKLVGVIQFADADKVNVGTAKEVYTPAAWVGDCTYVSDGGKLYAFLVTRTGFTPASGALFAINLCVEVD